MLRREPKKSASVADKKPSRVVEISFTDDRQLSPHVLDLRQELNPKKKEWIAPPMAGFLSNPFGKVELLDKKSGLISKKERNGRLLPGAMPGFVIDHEPWFEWRRVRWPKIIIFWSQKVFFSVKIMPLSLQKVAIGFLAAGLLFIAPIKTFAAYYSLKGSQSTMVANGTAAFEHLQKGEKALEAKDLLIASQELEQALELFSRTQTEINDISPVWRGLLSILPKVGAELRSGENLVMAGVNLTMAILPALSLLDSRGPEETWDKKLAKVDRILEQVLPRFQTASQHLAMINVDALPEDKRAEFDKIKQLIAAVSGDLRKLESISQSLGAILGQGEAKNYLVVFQNENEIRPTGGFIGSFAEIRVKNGQLAKLYLPGEGSYQLQGALKVALLPPAPLQLLKPKWEFQDANWFFDFPTSAKKIEWFYEKSNGPTVDGVIAIDTSVIMDLLRLTGPIELSQYQKNITADNFVLEIQKQVELEYDKTQNRPKQILSDLAPLLLDKVLKQENQFLPLLLTLNKSLNTRHIQVYLNNPALQEKIISRGWGGEVKDSGGGDYLAVVNSNISGGKTDGVIKQSIAHRAQISEDDSIIDTVTVTRRHDGLAGDIFTGWQNVDYMRVYVPAGSELLEAVGFGWPEEKHFKVPENWYKIDEDLRSIEGLAAVDNRTGTVITQEFGKTAFGNWVLVKPGQTSTVSLTYRLPFKASRQSDGWLDKLAGFLGRKQSRSSYSLLAQKQPGTKADELTHQLFWPENRPIVWTNQDNLVLRDGHITFRADLEEDRFLAVLLNQAR